MHVHYLYLKYVLPAGPISKPREMCRYKVDIEGLTQVVPHHGDMQLQIECYYV